MSMAFLLLALFFAALLDNSAAPRTKAIIPSPVDVPPGMYISSSVPTGLGDIESVRMAVEYTEDKCVAKLTFRHALNDGSFEYCLFELTPRILRRVRMSHGVEKCYYFFRGLTIKVYAYLSSKTGKQWDANSTSVLLCKKSASTSSSTGLTLYLRASRGAGLPYSDLVQPVQLILQPTPYTLPIYILSNPSTSRRGDGAGDKQPPSKKSRKSYLEIKPIEDGLYSHPFASLHVDTRADGRQHVLISSITDDWEISLLSDELLVPAEDHLTSGCFKLEKAALSLIRICPAGSGRVLLKGIGGEKTMILDPSVEG